jgi:hypothetical protein
MRALSHETIKHCYENVTAFVAVCKIFELISCSIALGLMLYKVFVRLPSPSLHPPSHFSKRKYEQCNGRFAASPPLPTKSSAKSAMFVPKHYWMSAYLLFKRMRHCLMLERTPRFRCHYYALVDPKRAVAHQISQRKCLGFVIFESLLKDSHVWR